MSNVTFILLEDNNLFLVQIYRVRVFTVTLRYNENVPAHIFTNKDYYWSAYK